MEQQPHTRIAAEHHLTTDSQVRESQGQSWRRKPEIGTERQDYLSKCRAINPDIEQGIYPFKNIQPKLTRADIEWLLETHDSGDGPIDWSDSNQHERIGLDLRGADLSEEDLTELPLARVQGGLSLSLFPEATPEQQDRAATDLRGADLRKADLQGADLWGTHLERARLAGAYLQGADLQGAYLTEAHLEGGTDLREARLEGAHLEGADLWGAHLEGTRLGKAHLREARLFDAHLERANLEGANLEKARLEEADLRKARLRGARLQGVDLRKANLQGTDLQRADLREARLEKARLEEADLREANLQGTKLQGADLQNAFLEKAHLEEADLREANLQGTKLQGANLRNAFLEKAHLEEADLREANLQGAKLSKAHLEGTDLSKAHLEGANLNNTILNGATNLAEVTIVDANKIGPFLADAQWQNVNFTIIEDQWQKIDRLGEEVQARLHQDLDGYKAAVRANRQLAVALQEQGLNEAAARFAYRAQILQRKVLWKQQHYWKWLGSALLALLAGYGYRMWHILVAYLCVVLLCAVAYFILGIYYMPLSFPEAVLTSVTAFHGRVFSEVFKPGIPEIWVTAVEAVVGLVIEGVFIAMLTQRFFGK